MDHGADIPTACGEKDCEVGKGVSFRDLWTEPVESFMFFGTSRIGGACMIVSQQGSVGAPVRVVLGGCSRTACRGHGQR